MSSSDRGLRARRIPALVTAAAASLLALSACTVQPLYGDRGAMAPAGTTSSSVGTELAYVSINPPRTREGQEVRNELIFLLAGGAGEPASPRYDLDLTVSSSIQRTASIQLATEDEPTAGMVILSARYVLRARGGREVLGRGQRQISSSFDRPRQEFAAVRAERDAQDRAARELAALLQLAVAQHLASRPGG